MDGAVQMRFEGNPVSSYFRQTWSAGIIKTLRNKKGGVGNFSYLRDFFAIRRSQRKYLKTARIRYDRTLPIHKSMQPSRISYEFIPGLQIQVIRIREDHFGSYVLYLLGSERFDGGLCADRHKGRSEYIAVRGF